MATVLTPCVGDCFKFYLERISTKVKNYQVAPVLLTDGEVVNVAREVEVRR